MINTDKLQAILPFTNHEQSQNQYQFSLLKNDWTPQITKDLIEVKNLISKGLPSMSKCHILKLVFDERHESIVVKEDDSIVGAITFRVFPKPNIAEIAFLVVKYERRVKGYGRKLVNQLKSQMQTRKVDYLLTFGDKNALGFFKKQGFNEHLTLDRDRWEGYIKEYEGGKFMECKIYQAIDYKNIDEIIKRQKEYLVSIIKERSINQIEFSGMDIPPIKVFQRKKNNGSTQTYQIDPRKIPGIIEAGWTWEEHDSLRSIQELSMEAKIQLIVKSIANHPDAWPFKEPVSEKQAKNYFQVIKNPMDLKTIGQKLHGHKYENQNQFYEDVGLMFQNCKQYNSQGSLYYKIAMKLEQKYMPVLQKLKDGIITESLKLL